MSLLDKISLGLGVFTLLALLFAAWHLYVASVYDKAGWHYNRYQFEEGHRVFRRAERLAPWLKDKKPPNDGSNVRGEA